MSKNNNLTIISSFLIIIGLFLIGSNYSEITGMATTGEGTSNISVDNSTAISLVTSNMNFLGATVGSFNDTAADNSPLPFIVRNDGNIYINVTVASAHNETFLSSLNDPDGKDNLGRGFFEGKCGNNETTCPLGSTTTYTVIPTVAKTYISSLQYAIGSDEVEFEINISVPASEPPGSKNNTLTFLASSAGVGQ